MGSSLFQWNVLQSSWASLPEIEILSENYFFLFSILIIVLCISVSTLTTFIMRNEHLGKNEPPTHFQYEVCYGYR